MFYKDQKFIGARKPFDYPLDIHFSNNHYHLSGDELNHNVRNTDADFSEVNYRNSDVHTRSVGFGGIDYSSKLWKTYLVAVAFGLSLYLYNKKKK